MKFPKIGQKVDYIIHDVSNLLHQVVVDLAVAKSGRFLV